MESERVGLVGFLRALREFRRLARMSERPVISADDAPARYEPLIESVAAELSAEFGVEFRRAEHGQSTRGRRVFETNRWVVDRSLSRFPDWRRRLDAAVRRVADIVSPDVRMNAFGVASAEPPAQMASHPEVRAMKGDPFGEAGDDVGIVFMSQHISLRDRLGGDVLVIVDDSQTVLSAIASIRPD